MIIELAIVNGFTDKGVPNLVCCSTLNGDSEGALCHQAGCCTDLNLKGFFKLWNSVVDNGNLRTVNCQNWCRRESEDC